MSKGRNKNVRRKLRRFQQGQNGVKLGDRFELLKKIAEKWGKEIVFNRTLDPTGGVGGCEQHIIYLAFGNIPFIVIGAKGIGASTAEADANCAWNFLSFIQNYVSRSTVNGIRQKWVLAEIEILEVVRVCRTIEAKLDTEQFHQLREVPVLAINPPEKIWARQLRNELRQVFNQEQIIWEPSKPTIFTEQAMKRKLVPLESCEDSPSKKRTKMDDSQLSNNLRTNGTITSCGKANDNIGTSTSSFISSSPICLDDTDDEYGNDDDDDYDDYDDDDDNDDDNDVQLLNKVAKADVSLNISDNSYNNETENLLPKTSLFSNSKEQKSSDCINLDQMFEGYPDLASWCIARNIPLNFEKDLIGVECNTEALSNIIKIQAYRKKYVKEFDLLDEDIWRHYQYNAQTDEIYAWKMGVREILLIEFQKAFPRQHVQMFAVGSTINGCGSYNSDMDMCLCIPNEGTTDEYNFDRGAAMRILRKLNGMIKGKPTLRRLVKFSQVVPAKVPIIKMEMHPPNEELDLDINVNNTPGIYNSHLIHYYSRVDLRFPALCLLIKHWAINNDINDAMNGTLNSYSLILLVLHYMQCGVRPAVLPNLQFLYPERFGSMPSLCELKLFGTLDNLPERPKNIQTLGELLIGFFYYYASFDFSHHAISVRNAKRYPRSALPLETSHFQIYIEEPFDGKNTARCVSKDFTMERIRRAFRSAKDAFSNYAPSLSRIKVNV